MTNHSQLTDDLCRLRRDYADLCRAAWILVRHWETLRVARTREEALLRDTLCAARVPCRCDPPGSWEEWCTGHCIGMAESIDAEKGTPDAP